MPQIVVGTAGHIDHGKTSLVRALTGVNTDNLVEEKARGMTIDIGFAYLNDKITIIDVPGHEKFIRNMVAGAANIHYGLIVVAADDGIMPQTIEHLDILTQLGINQGWVAITKVDMVNDKEWIDLVELDIKECLDARDFHTFSVNQIDSLNGDGVEKLKSDIFSIEVKKEHKLNSNYFRMNVDRVFSKTGFGTVVTGTVVNGFVKKGSEVEILPFMCKGRIRGLQSHGGSTDKVIAGDRAAINLSSIKVDEVSRGSVICTQGIIEPTQKIITNISMIKSTNWKIRNNQRLRFHFGTSEVLGRVKIHSGKVLKKSENLNLCLFLESPMAVGLDDRFVVRSYSPMETIAGGVVLHPNSNLIGTNLNIDKVVSNIPINPDERFRFLVKLCWMHPKTLEYWIKLFFNSKYEIQFLNNYGDLKLSDNGILYSDYGKEKSINEIKKYFNKYYKKNPFRKVVNVDSIRNTLSWSEEWLEVVMTQMIQEKIIEYCKGGYALVEYKIKFGEKDINDIRVIEVIFENKGLQPISLTQIIKIAGYHPKRLGELMHILIGKNKITPIGNDFYLHNKQLVLLISQLKEYFSEQDTLSVRSFKKITGLTRKSAIPLLEYLDKNKFTYREENMRLAGVELEG